MKIITTRTLRGSSVVLALFGFAALSAQAQDAPSPCASVTDDKSRLQCYDAEATMKKGRPAASAAAPAPAPAARSTAPTPAPAAAPVAQPAPATGSAETGFGAELLPKKAKAEGEPEPASEITAKVTSVAGRGKGEYRIGLDNGQMWAETQRTGGEPPEVGDTITLRRGSMGSYFLTKGTGLALRVKRVK
jgi:hypothetical protein